jgi:hypothetical protein
MVLEYFKSQLYEFSKGCFNYFNICQIPDLKWEPDFNSDLQSYIMGFGNLHEITNGGTEFKAWKKSRRQSAYMISVGINEKMTQTS